MNFSRKIYLLLIGFFYLIIGVGWVVLIYKTDSQATFHLSIVTLLLDLLLAVIWPFYPFNFLLYGERNLKIMGGVGLALALIIFGTLIFFIIRKNQGEDSGDNI